MYSLLTLLLVTILSMSNAFKITRFEVPSEVRIGSTARLVCEYELVPYRQLYTLRWLRNNVEFYRYDPALTPRHNFYKIHGLHVNVYDNNVSKSNGTRLYIDHVSKEDTEGLYTCEVTTFPHFARVQESKRMAVVEHPTHSLELKKGEEPQGHTHRRGRKNQATVGQTSSLGILMSLIFSALYFSHQ